MSAEGGLNVLHRSRAFRYNGLRWYHPSVIVVSDLVPRYRGVPGSLSRWTDLGFDSAGLRNVLLDDLGIEGGGGSSEEANGGGDGGEAHRDSGVVS